MSTSVAIYARLPPESVVVDVRHPDDRLDRDLQLPSHAVEVIPFFEVQKVLASRPRDQQYLLYCDRGIMSRLHAELLFESGYTNIGVYKP